MMFIASIGILIYGLTLTRPLVRILQVPQTLIMPVIFVLCVVGSFAIAQTHVRRLRDAGLRRRRASSCAS